MMNKGYETMDNHREEANYDSIKITGRTDSKDLFREDFRENIRDKRRGRSEFAHDFLDDYDDYEIREEIEVLKTSLVRLKRALDERKSENVDMKMAVKSLEQSTCESLTTVADTLREMNDRINQFEELFVEKIDMKLEKMRTELHDDLDEMNMPISAKCETLEERIVSVQRSVEENDYTEILDRVQLSEENVKESFTEKFGTKTIGNVLQKQGFLQTFVIANTVGTLMILVLMIFFIISLL